MSINWYLSASDDYLSGYENEEFEQNGTSAFEDILYNSPESYTVIHNDQTTRMIVQDQDDSEKKKFLARLYTLNRGDLIKHKERNWLILDFVDDNKMYQIARGKLCNTEIIIDPPEVEREPIGYDDWGNPIYEDDVTVTEPFSIPAIAEKRIVDEELNSAINLEEDKINITIPYTDVEFKKFKVYGESYVVKGIDQTKVIDNQGILTILGERG